MARKSRNKDEGRSRITRGRKLHDLEDSETEEELKRFLEQGTDFDAPEAEEAGEQESDEGYKPFRLDQAEAFGSLGQFWLSEN